jgi:hypothetical protein
MRPVENTSDEGWHLIGQGQPTGIKKTRADEERKGDDTEQCGARSATCCINKRGDINKECESETTSNERSV